VTVRQLTRDFIVLRALRWLPQGVVLPFQVLIPQSRGLSLGAIGVVFAVHSAVALALEVPSGALADLAGRRRTLLAGAALTVLSLIAFAAASSLAAFCGSLALMAAGRALISGSLEAWYVDALRLLDPVAPLARGLSAGTAAEGVAMALGAVAGGGIVVVSGYTAAALGGAAAAAIYLVAVAALVREPPRQSTRVSLGRRTRELFATARRETATSPAVQVVFAWSCSGSRDWRRWSAAAAGTESGSERSSPHRCSRWPPALRSARSSTAGWASSAATWSPCSPAPCSSGCSACRPRRSPSRRSTCSPTWVSASASQCTSSCSTTPSVQPRARR
jgi:MFS family permease